MAAVTFSAWRESRWQERPSNLHTVPSDGGRRGAAQRRPYTPSRAQSTGIVSTEPTTLRNVTCIIAVTPWPLRVL